MKLRLISDVHVDFDAYAYSILKHDHPDRAKTELEYLWAPEPLPDDLDTVLILAGDLWSQTRAFEVRGSESWIARIASRFKAIILVLGNHDYWGESLQRAPQKAKEEIKRQGLLNVHVLERDAIIIDGVKLLGGTLWTDYNKGSPLTMLAATRYMKDYDKITYGSSNVRRKVQPADILAVHRATKGWLVESCKRDHPAQKLIVVTHMLPSFKSIDERYHTSSSYEVNFSYFSDLDQLVNDLAPDFWVHGHSHSPSDYMIGTTRVLCNPRGYYQHERTGYDPWLTIDTVSNAVLRTSDLMP